MATDIRYQPGKPIRFISTRSFQLGNTGQSVLEGMEILFDGTNVELNGSRYILPTLRGAVKLRWMVPDNEYDPDAAPQANISANIGVRPANDLGQNPLSPARKSAITTVESDERVVNTRGNRTQQAMQQTQDARANQGRAGAFVARGASAEIGGAEFGVPVERTFKTQAKSYPEVTPNSVGTAIREADSVKVQPGEGISEEQLLSRMSEEDRIQYMASKEAKKADIQSRTPGYVPPPAVTTNLASQNQAGMKRQERPARVVTASESVVAGRVAPTATRVQEGISVGVTTGGGTEIFDPTTGTGRAQESTTISEGISFKNTNGPKKAFSNTTVTNPPVFEESQPRIERDGTADARRQVGKALCKDFPNEYNFSDHWKRRLAMIRLNYEGRVDIIRAIFAAESDDFKRTIIEEFPEAFAS